MKYIEQVAILIAFSVFLCISTGCTSYSDRIKNDNYRQEFTDSEMEEGHAEFEVAEHLSIDADITPLEKYEDGLNSYYQIQYADTGVIDDAEKLMEETTIFGNSQPDFYAWLQKVTGGYCDTDAMECYSAGLEASIQGEVQRSEDALALVMNWTSAEVLGNYAYWPYLILNGGGGSDIYNYSIYMQACLTSDKYDTELSFADREKTAEEWIKWLEELTGRNYSDTWDCVSISGDTLSSLKETECWESENINTDIGEYYAYSFYYDIDGIPVDYIGFTYEMQGDETCTDIAGATLETQESSILTVLPEWPQSVVTGENGVVYMEIDNFRSEGKVYKESQTILTPTEILEKIAAYYDTTLLLDDVIITDMRLVYCSYFTDGEDGPVDNAFCPFWKATVYDKAEERNKVFVYDAVTGEAFYEASDIQG